MHLSSSPPSRFNPGTSKLSFSNIGRMSSTSAGTVAELMKLILKDKYGQPRPLSKEALVGLFEVLNDNIRVVVLNACHTKAQAEAVAQVVDLRHRG